MLKVMAYQQILPFVLFRQILYMSKIYFIYIINFKELCIELFVWRFISSRGNLYLVGIEFQSSLGKGFLVGKALVISLVLDTCTTYHYAFYLKQYHGSFHNDLFRNFL